DPDRIAVPTADVAGLALEADHPVWTDAIVPGGVRLGPDVVHVAADAGEILTQGGGPAARRAHGIVQPVHQQGVARRGVQVRARLIAQGRRAGADAAAIAERDDDLVILQEVAGAEAGVTVQRIGDAHPAARRTVVIRRIFAEVVTGVEQVEARAHVATQEFGLGEAEVDLLTERTPFGAGHDVLAATAEVALGNAQVQHEGVDRAEARADRQFAGGLFFDGDVDDGTVRRAAARLFDLDVLEEAQGAQVIARPLDQRAVEGVALAHHQLAADDAVQGAGVADHIDAVDLDTLAFADMECDVDGVVIGVRAMGRIDFDEGVTGRT